MDCRQRLPLTLLRLLTTFAALVASGTAPAAEPAGAAAKSPQPSAGPPNPASPAPAPTVTLEPEAVLAKAKSAIVRLSVEGRVGDWLGTGFVVDAEGLIATNFHVLGRSRRIEVRFANGKTYTPIAVEASDREMDLAILRIRPDAPLAPLPLGDEETLQPGQEVLGIGNPLGLDFSPARGVFSAAREIEDRPMLQLAMPIEPGNSGGPVMDRHGQVVGVVTMKSRVLANLGFAIPTKYLKALLADPNPVTMSAWLNRHQLDANVWEPVVPGRPTSGRPGEPQAQWTEHAGAVEVEGMGTAFGGRTLCLATVAPPPLPYEVAVSVKLEEASGAAGLVFAADGKERHYGFYPSEGRLRLTRFAGPTVVQWSILSQVDSESYRPGEYNRLRVRVEADRIRCFVNGQLVIESDDRVLRGGRVGLAAFRGTNAAFRDFAVAAELPPDAPTAEQVSAVLTHLGIEALLPSKAGTAADRFLAVDRILADASLSTTSAETVLAQRAAQLRQQAQELNDLASELHIQTVCRRLADLAGGGGTVDMIEASLQIARLDNPTLDIAGYRREFDRLAAGLLATLGKERPLPAIPEADRLDRLNQFLFREQGFHGNRFDYDNPRNSYFHDVLDDRTGLPITLAVLYLELGKRLQLRMEGVGMPGHFVVRHRPTDPAAEPQLVDVFGGGVVLSRADAALRVLRSGNLQLTDDHLQATPERDILRRMLRNLRSLAERDGDPSDALKYLDAAIAIDPAAPEERLLRGVLRWRLGAAAAALADIDLLLQADPPGLDLDAVRTLRSRIAGDLGKAEREPADTKKPSGDNP